MKKWVMLMLVLYTLLGSYKLPIGVDIPLNTVIFLLLFIITIIRGKKIDFNFSKEFTIYWLYISIVYIFFSTGFKLTLFIPGGLAFCFWVIALTVSLRYFDFDLLKKYYKVTFVICAAVFFIQEISYFTYGYRPIFLLPLPLSGDASYDAIWANQINLDRSSCFFREPSHFAQFALPLLAIELIDAPRKGKIFTGFSIFIILTLILLRSGNGFYGMIILVAIRIWTYLKYAKFRYKLIALFVFIPLITVGTFKYIQTEQGTVIAERASGISMEEGSSSFMRTFRGYYLYDDLPTLNKVFGISIEGIHQHIRQSKVSYMFISPITGEYDDYLNGIQTILISNGLIGLLLFLLIFIKLYRNNNILSKSLIVLFIALMFIGNLYLSQVMLICTLLPWYYKCYIRKKEIVTK